jgi:hypothetical protein
MAKILNGKQTINGENLSALSYISECELFVRVDYKHADEILAEYNDCYIFNMAQYANIYHSVDEILEDDDAEPENEEADELRRLHMAEKNAKAATDHFVSLFGSKDFGESVMVGFRPAWYDLQKILLQEYKHKTPVQESAMNRIAPYLRTVASIALFAERIISEMQGFDAAPERIAEIKEGFKHLIARAEAGEVLQIPEYNKTKATFLKYKKMEQFADFAEKLFREAGENK